MGGKRLKASRSDGTGGSKKRVKVANGDEKKLPVISSSGELVRKLIDHFCFLEDEDVESWHRGVVLKTFGRKKFLIRYIMIVQMSYIHNYYLKNLRQEMLELLN